MSKYNKVNKTNYVQRGRLTPDEIARERKRQAEISAGAKGKERVRAGKREPDARGASRPRSAREE